MNHDLFSYFIDVQTHLITPICPHYAKQVRMKIMNKNGFAMHAGWPVSNPPNITLKVAKKYLQNLIALMINLCDKKNLRQMKRGMEAT